MPEPSPQFSQPLKEEKKRLRAIQSVKRESLSCDCRASAASHLAQFGLAFLKIQEPCIVSGYYPMGEECDCLPLLAKLEAEGHSLVLPVVAEKDSPLIFRRWVSGGPLEEAAFGVSIPPAGAEELEPGIFLVPLLAFDREGYRLGYGGGFYDRTLAEARKKRPVIAVGVAYDEQEVETVPHDDLDEQLDWMLTPSGPMDFGA